MIGILRRCRLLAAVLLLATPGLGGAWLPVIHPCAVDTPWMASKGTHHGRDASHTPSQAPSQGHCHCIAASQVGSAAVLPLVASLTPPPQPVERPVATLAPAFNPPVQRPADRLPPATAPPLA